MTLEIWISANFVLQVLKENENNKNENNINENNINENNIKKNNIKKKNENKVKIDVLI